MWIRRSNTVILALALCAALTLPAVAQKHSKNLRKTYKQVIAQLEEQWLQAQAQGDVAALDKLLADDYTGISAQGMVSTKAETLAHVQARQFVVHDLQVHDEKIAIHGDTAVVTSRVELDAINNATQPPSPIHSHFRYTRVYVRYPSGAWRIVNFESTHISDKPGREPHSAEPPPPVTAIP